MPLVGGKGENAYSVKMQDFAQGAVLTEEEVHNLIGDGARILMNAGTYSGINNSKYENDCTQSENKGGIHYIPEAHLENAALAKLYERAGHEVEVTAPVPGELDGIYSTDSDKTFIVVEPCEGGFKVIKIVSFIPHFTNRPREIEADRKEAELKTITVGGEREEREIHRIPLPMEFGDTRIFMQGSVGHPGPFIMAGIADTSAHIHGIKGINPADKFSILQIDDQDVFPIAVYGNRLTLLKDLQSGEEEDVDISNSTLLLQNCQTLEKVTVKMEPEAALDLGTVGRSKRAAQIEFQRQLQESTGIDIEVVPVCTRQPFYHMDTTGFQTNDGRFFTTESAFTPGSRELLAHLFGDKLVYLDRDDIGQGFGGNATSFGNNIYISDRISAKAARQISALGYHVHVTPIPHTMMNGGGHRCMTSVQHVVSNQPGLTYEKFTAPTPGEGRVFKAGVEYKTGQITYGEVELESADDKDIMADVPYKGKAVSLAFDSHVDKYHEAMLRKEEAAKLPKELEVRNSAVGTKLVPYFQDVIFGESVVLKSPVSGKLGLFLDKVKWPADVSVLADSCVHIIGDYKPEQNGDILHDELVALLFRLTDPDMPIELSDDHTIPNAKLLGGSKPDVSLACALIALKLLVNIPDKKQMPGMLDRFMNTALGGVKHIDEVVAAIGRHTGAYTQRDIDLSKVPDISMHSRIQHHCTEGQPALVSLRQGFYSC